MNKIRGEHDYQDDRDELDQLLDAGYDSEVTELLEGRDEADEFDDLLDTVEGPDFEPTGSEKQPDLDEKADEGAWDTNRDMVTCPECGEGFVPPEDDD